MVAGRGTVIGPLEVYRGPEEQQSSTGQTGDPECGRMIDETGGKIIRWCGMCRGTGVPMGRCG